MFGYFIYSLFIVLVPKGKFWIILKQHSQRKTFKAHYIYQKQKFLHKLKGCLDYDDSTMSFPLIYRFYIHVYTNAEDI